MVQAVPVRCGFSPLASKVWAAGFSRWQKTAASDQAHVRGAWPMVVPEGPERVPAEALAHVTRRHEEAPSCPRQHGLRETRASMDGVEQPETEHRAKAGSR